MRYSISVVIPVRNGAETVAAAIDSVLGQTLPPHEIIVIDDGSTDGTTDILTRYGSKLRVLEGPCLGAGPARNVGILEASGDYIAFLDADDRWLSSKLEEQSAHLSDHTVLGSYARYVAGQQRYVLGASIRTKDDDEAFALVKAGAALPALLSSWVIPRDLLMRVGLFDPNYVYAQDYELAVRLVQSGAKFRVVRKVLIEYFLHADSETAQAYTEQFLTAAYVRQSLAKATDLELKEWLKIHGVRRLWTRRARAGFYFRRGLILVGARKRVKAPLYLGLSLILSPRDFFDKAKRQFTFESLTSLVSR